MLLPIRFHIVSPLTPPRQDLNTKFTIVQQFWDSYQLFELHSFITPLKYLSWSRTSNQTIGVQSLAINTRWPEVFYLADNNVVLASDFETTCLLLHLSPIITNTRPKLPTMPPFCSGFHTKLLKTGDFAGVLLQEITFQQRKRIKDDYQKKESI